MAHTYTFASVLAGQGWDASRLRNAQAHFERARLMDPSNVVAEAFLNQVSPTHQACGDETLRAHS